MPITTPILPPIIHPTPLPPPVFPVAPTSPILPTPPVAPVQPPIGLPATTTYAHVVLSSTGSVYKVGDIVQLAAQVTGLKQPLDYYWIYGNGGTGHTSQNSSGAIYNKPGVYSVQLKVTDVLGNSASAVPISITITSSTASTVSPFVDFTAAVGSLIGSWFH
jgi:hypothetical protein